MIGRNLIVAVAGVALVAAVPAAAQDHLPALGADFPRYASIEPNVRFWTRVYGEWGLDRVVVHDARRPELIYEILTLPGPVGERYSDAQREFLDERIAHWRGRLTRLEHDLGTGQPLDDEQKQLAIQVTTSAGSEAIRGAADRIRTQRGVRERFRRGVEIGRRYDALIRETLREEGVPEALAYLPHVESSFQSQARSSAGAVGAWQFTRSAGRRYMHVTSAFDERLDVVLAARGAARYLRDAYAKLGQWPLALTSYNHGVGGMTQAVAALGPDYERIFLEYEGRLFGFASRNFYSEFLAAVDVASRAETFFPEGISPEPPFDHDRLTLPRAASPRAIARRHGLAVAELAAINPAWTSRAVRSDLSIPAHATVWLPRGTLSAARPPAAAPGNAERAARGTEYVVRPGDTLTSIATRHAVDVEDLMRSNGLADPSIQPGQRLVVTESSQATSSDDDHVVRPGETLSTIARAHGLSVDRLRSLNGLGTGDTLIRPGDRLRVRPDESSRSTDAVHVVRKGETLLRIATRYGVQLTDLLHINELDLHAVIHPGQQLVIPFLPR